MREFLNIAASLGLLVAVVAVLAGICWADPHLDRCTARLHARWLDWLTRRAVIRAAEQLLRPDQPAPTDYRRAADSGLFAVQPPEEPQP